MRTILKKILFRQKKFDSTKYWEHRYKSGGNSGDGSYGKLAEFKANFLNSFIQQNSIESIIEFGCGDGHQLSLLKCNKYLGLDVSPTVIQHCIEKFKSDKSKSFFRYHGSTFINNKFIEADLALSLDVIYHIIEENIFKKYLFDLFGSSTKYVIIYSTNYNTIQNGHELHRKFVDFIERNIIDFKLVKEFENPYSGSGEQESDANFYVFERNVRS